MKTETRLRVVAGLIDSGSASLATFGALFYAARYFSPAALGVYSLLFSAFLVARLISEKIFFVPVEVEALRIDRVERVGLLDTSLPVGSVFALVPALGVALVAAPFLELSSPETSLSLAVSATALTFLAPLQDHIRRVFHLSGSSWAAAAVSVVRLVVVGVTILVVTIRVGFSSWVPFGSLATGAAVSIVVGYVLSRLRPQRRRMVIPKLRVLMKTGRWLLAAGLFASGSRLIAGFLVVSLASVGALGYAEAARAVAQPLVVFAVGFGAVLGPRSMEASQARDRTKADHIARIFMVLVLLVSVVYMAFAAWVWKGNFIAQLLVAAYDIRGLVALSLLAAAVSMITLPYQYELVAGRRERGVAQVEGVGATLTVAVAAAAGILGSFAIPLGVLVLGAVRWFGYRRNRAQLFGRSRPSELG